MRKRTKIIGWLLHFLRERLIEHRSRLYHRAERIDGWVDRLDKHEGERYWRVRDRGL